MRRKGKKYIAIHKDFFPKSPKGTVPFMYEIRKSPKDLVIPNNMSTFANESLTL
ncbi:MAG: hypothetical protein IJ159_01935 [Prevotella sp.]|nr:hypothetical protein [Prevotella sp.]